MAMTMSFRFVLLAALSHFCACNLHGNVLGKFDIFILLSKSVYFLTVT